MITWQQEKEDERLGRVNKNASYLHELNRVYVLVLSKDLISNCLSLLWIFSVMFQVGSLATEEDYSSFKTVTIRLWLYQRYLILLKGMCEYAIYRVSQKKLRPV